MRDFQNLCIYLKISEFMMSSIVSLLHTTTEFSIPQIGYGSNQNIIILSTAFAAMMIPFAVRLQASVLKEYPFEPITVSKTIELLFTIAGFLCYTVGGLLTVLDWRRTQSNKNIFFRTSYNEIFLAKGIISFLLSLICSVDVYIAYTYSKEKFEYLY